MSRQDIENGEKQWVEAFNAGDAPGVTALYTPDARLMAPNIESLQGADAMMPMVQSFIDTGVQMAFDLVAVHEAPDLCAAVGRYDMTAPDGTSVDRGKFVEIWTKQADGQWRIVDDIFNSDLPASP